MFLARLARKGRMDRYRVVLLMQIFVRRVQVTGTGLDVVSMRDVRNRRDRRVLMGALELCVWEWYPLVFGFGKLVASRRFPDGVVRVSVGCWCLTE